jgi:hypothetical protein
MNDRNHQPWLLAIGYALPQSQKEGGRLATASF